jgi:hypothetical protein
MSGLLLEKDLRTSEEDSEVRSRRGRGP